MRKRDTMISGLLALLLAGPLAAQQFAPGNAPRKGAPPSVPALLVTWEARPGDLGYRLYLSTNDNGDDLMVDLPAGVTGFRWPLRTTTSRWPRDSVQVSTCLNRRIDSTVPITNDDAGWAPARCVERWYHPPKPEPELRLQIRKADR